MSNIVNLLFWLIYILILFSPFMIVYYTIIVFRENNFSKFNTIYIKAMYFGIFIFLLLIAFCSYDFIYNNIFKSTFAKNIGVSYVLSLDFVKVIYSLFVSSLFTLITYLFFANTIEYLIIRDRFITNYYIHHLLSLHTKKRLKKINKFRQDIADYESGNITKNPERIRILKSVLWRFDNGIDWGYSPDFKLNYVAKSNDGEEWDFYEDD